MFIPRKEVIKSGTVWDLDVINQITYQGVPFIPSTATDEKIKVTAADTTAGYLAGKVAAGSGIQLTTTNPGGNETLTIACNVVDLDVKVAVSATDTTAGFLNGKLVAGSNITLTQNNTGGNETLTIAANITDTNDAVKVSSNDTTAGFLNGKLVAGTNITLTENNNGLNETLTIAATVPVTSVNTKTGAVTLNNTDVGAAATVHVHAGSDITSGTIATARLATGGVASSSTYLRGDQVWASAPVTSVNSQTGAVSLNAASVGASPTGHTHAASDITSGIISTARLGSGTADNTTYLRGDGTWASVSAGLSDTIYTATSFDAENTTNNVSLISFNVPGGSWNDQEFIDIELLYRTYNITGSSQTLTLGVYVSGVLHTNNYASSISTSSNWFGKARIRLLRNGTNMQHSTFAVDDAGYDFLRPGFAGSVAGYNWTGYAGSYYNFAATQTISIRAQWPVASPSLFLRIQTARAVKYGGQF